MESVYKLSKYSQKISEACRAKQLNKVMEYNQHELAHINKLSKYFGNQKGGADVQAVVKAVSELVQAVVTDKDAEMKSFLQDINEQIKLEEEKAFSLEGEQSPQQLLPRKILDKVDMLVRSYNKIQADYTSLWKQLDKLKSDMQKIHTEIYNANNGGQRSSSVLSVSVESILDQFNEFKYKAQEDTKSHTDKLVRAIAEIKSISEARIQKLEEDNAQAQAQAQSSKDAAIKSDESVIKIQTELAKAQKALGETQLQLSSTEALNITLKSQLKQSNDSNELAIQQTLQLQSKLSSAEAHTEELEKTKNALTDTLAQLEAVSQKKGGSKKRA